MVLNVAQGFRRIEVDSKTTLLSRSTSSILMAWKPLNGTNS